MTTDTTHLIVGASLTEAKAAETLRAEGFDGPLIMIGRCGHRRGRDHA
jgi:3-phenylpropionate/trans-cinnamate dioxygenase ferredoxin reductase component